MGNLCAKITFCNSTRLLHNGVMGENQLVIYTSPKGEIRIEARVKGESIWLSQKQIAELFNTDRTVITRHLRNIFKIGELSESEVCAKNAQMAPDGTKYVTKYYNLDAIVSVGYRVNSQKATQFRIWATKTLRSYLVKGYAINEKLLLEQKRQLEDIKQTILMIGEKSSNEMMKGHEGDLLQVITEYAKSWRVLDQFDLGQLSISHLRKVVEYELEYKKSKHFILEMRREMVRSGLGNELFGQENGEKLKSILGSINQTYDGEDLYPSLEEKAAHLFYFAIKDHPFVDGNKRIGSMLFLYFLKRNDFLYRSDGEVKINDNSIIALALLVAASNPKEKDNIIRLIINLLQD